MSSLSFRFFLLYYSVFKVQSSFNKYIVLTLNHTLTHLSEFGGLKSRVIQRLDGLNVSLNFHPAHLFKMSLVGSNGLEPSTSRLSGVRSNHLSYEPLLEWWRLRGSNS